MFLTDITIGQSLLYSIVAIAGVFLILLIIVLCVNILSLIKFNDDGTPKNKKAEPAQASAPVANSVNPALVEADDDMMAAVLVASIDFYNETKQNARCVSVKQIN
ncbi:MAG: OadG family protein [Bacilli bacterium]|nr:OadG family protein [Bacilli bacterium]